MKDFSKIGRRIIEITVIVAFSCILFVACQKGKTDDGVMVLHSDGDAVSGDENNENTKTPETEDEHDGVGTDKEQDSGAEDKTVCVYVCGAVCNAGVYELPENSRVIDALNMAGGFLPDAREDGINLADTVTDGEMLRFPFEGEEIEVLSSGRDHPGDEDASVNINTAGKEKLLTIPGVGEVRADAIIKYREESGGFQSPEDLMKVPGIKEGTYDKMKDYVKVE